MQPEHVPIVASDRIRPIRRLPPPRRWLPRNPTDLGSEPISAGPAFGIPGSDQGYALKLAEKFSQKLILKADEHDADAMAGAVAVALRRASLVGRSPVVFDIEAGLLLWGFIGDPPTDLVEYRKTIFRGAAEDYWCRRQIAASVPLETFRLAPKTIFDRRQDWTTLLGVSQKRRNVQ